MKLTRRLANTQGGRILLFALIMLPTLLVCGVVKTDTVHAINWRNPVLLPDPGSGGEPAIPTIPKNSLEGCVNADGISGGGFYTPAIAAWVSQQGKPWVIDVPVTYGQTSVSLDYNTAYAVCSPLSTADQVNTAVFGATVSGGASASGLGAPFAPLFIPVGFGSNYNDRGYYIRPSRIFTFTKPGGFTSTATYTISATQATIIHYKNGVYVCNTRSGPVKHTDSMTDFGKCDAWPVDFKIKFTVPTVQPPTNHTPTGSLSGGCTQGLTATFNDQDGATFARIMKGSSNVANSDVSPLKYNGVSNDAALSPATYQLQVQDRQPQQTEGTGTWVNVGSPVTVGPCDTIGCGSVTTPSGSAEQGDPFELDASYTYSGSSPPPAPTSDSLTINGKTYPGAGTLNYSASGGTATLTVPLPPGVTINAAGNYPVHWTITFAGAPTVCNGSISVYNKPYFQVLGGDVSAGGGIPSVNSTFQPQCTPAPVDANAIVASWNKRNATAYDGAGAQYAVRALLGIVDFASGQGGPGGVANPVAFTFANTNTGNADAARPVTVDRLGGNFGGSFGTGSAAPPCDTTIIDNALAAGLPRTAATAPGVGTGFSVGTGNQTYVVEGQNVFLQHNIQDTSTSWGTDVNNIPHFQLVVLGGNIYVAPGVTTLDGLYYAAPDTLGNGGQIITCATSTAPVADAALSATCGTQLTVNGSLMAKRILLLRTAGSLHDAGTASATPAETINYSPEMWITSGSSAGPDDSYTSLPPVL